MTSRVALHQAEPSDVVEPRRGQAAIHLPSGQRGVVGGSA
jgi:hypothetical protein